MKRPRKFEDSCAAVLSYRSEQDGVNYTFKNLKETGRSQDILNKFKKLKGSLRFIVQYETKPVSAIVGLGIIKEISEEGIIYSRLWIRQPPLKTNIIKEELLHFGYSLRDSELKKFLKEFFEM